MSPRPPQTAAERARRAPERAPRSAGVWPIRQSHHNNIASRYSRESCPLTNSDTMRSTCSRTDPKMRIIEETLAPGAVVTEIARRHGIATSLVFTWRRQARLATLASAGPRLVPVQVARLRPKAPDRLMPQRRCRRGSDAARSSSVTASASALTRMLTLRRWGGFSMS